MYKGFILFESLTNPLILNSFEKIYVVVEDTKDGEPRFWNDYKVKIPDDKIQEATSKLNEVMKPTWYAHFWNENEIVVVLPNKVFKIPRKNWKESAEYKVCIEFAVQNGVEEKYLDFWIQEEDIPKTTD